MCGGGGGTYVQEPDPMVEAKAAIKKMRKQYKFDERARLAALESDREQSALDRQQWDEDLGTARTGAYGGIQSKFKDAGLDPTDYDDRINAALDIAQAGIGRDTSPVFGSDLGSSLIDNIRNETIKGYQKQVNDIVPAGFENKSFTGTADDAVIAAILDEQFGTASDTILRARDRGTLNDVGFDYAMANLDNQRKTADARLQDIGGGILGGYRTQLGDLAGEARSAAGDWDFGDDVFDVGGYDTRLTELQGELGGRLEGDIRNAIGGEQFFNTNDLISKGGINQGAYNTGLGGQSGSLIAAINQRKQEDSEKRGLGTRGSF